MRSTPAPLAGNRAAPDGTRFTWGPIDAVHTVGEYQIVEYREDRSNFRRAEEWDGHGRTLFHPYIGGRDLHRGYLSLDSALVGAIAYKREGPNSRAADYFERMTGATP
ncbi:MAG: hypothetical protein ABR616_15455 [Dermatophilaceae bacterium]